MEKTLRKFVGVLTTCVLCWVLVGCDKDDNIDDSWMDYSTGNYVSCEHLMSGRDAASVVEEVVPSYYVMHVPANGGVFRIGLSPDAVEVVAASHKVLRQITCWQFIAKSGQELVWNRPVGFPEIVSPKDGDDVNIIPLFSNDSGSRFVECDVFRLVTQPQLDEFVVEIFPNSSGRERQYRIQMEKQYGLPGIPPYLFVVLQAGK